MNTLFTDLSLPAGFRLHQFEVLNWGTFDGIIHRVETHGQTTLLTGANGAGKTTLVDGLLTLLTPPGRFYNQSSGTETRQDRSERTYVLGHYGRSAQDGHLEARADALRQPGCHSVLLACFRDERGGGCPSHWRRCAASGRRAGCTSIFWLFRTRWALPRWATLIAPGSGSAA